MKSNHEFGGVDVIFGIIALFFLGGFLLIVNGYPIDLATAALSSPMFTSAMAHQSQFIVVAITGSLIMFQCCPVLFIIGIFGNAIRGSIQQFSGYSSMSTMAIEMIECTFVQAMVVILMVFGGYGLNSVLYAATEIGTGQGSGFWMLQQYLPQIYCAVLLLIQAGIIIHYFLVCVSVTDAGVYFVNSQGTPTQQYDYNQPPKQ
jgi:hypothetical protein